MSQENVEVIRRGYEAFAEGRIAFELLDPEIEWRGPREFPDLAEPHHGHEGFEGYRMVAEECIDAGGDQVLVFTREGGRGRGSGAEVETHPTGHLWTLRDSKAIRCR